MLHGYDHLNRADQDFGTELGTGHRSPLDWLSAILWPDGRTTLSSDGPDGPDGTDALASWDRGEGPRSDRVLAGGRTWFASPSTLEPRILIPDSPPAAARRAVRRYHDGFGAFGRVRSLAAEAVMGAPPVARALLGRSRVRTMKTIPADGSPAERGVIDWLAELMEVPDLSVAIGLSIPKSNRKPVLQLLDGRGRCLGWAKVGWNRWTEDLVSNEARWLRPPTSDPLVVPELLYEVDLCGRRVVVTSSVDAGRLPRRRPDALPPLGVFQAVAHRGNREVAPIDESAWFRSVISVLVDATDRERSLIEETLDRCDGHRFELGAWHGDLTPWNLMTVGRRVQLIDWELAADGVPFGFDLCHFHTQVAAEMKGLPAFEALDRSARLSPQGLAALGVEARNRSAVWHLYLVELVRRMIGLRRVGYPTEGLTHGPAALSRLGRMSRPSTDTAETTRRGEPAEAVRPRPGLCPVTERMIEAGLHDEFGRP